MKQSENTNTRRPNLLFVFSDQQSYDAIGPTNPQVKTPNIDAFASQGVRFDHAVANCPVCTPCRSMLITGRHPLHNNCFNNDRRLLSEDQIGPGIGHLLRDAGYRTGYVGKWHLLGGERNRPVPAGRDRHGFDDLFLTNNCHVNYEPGNCYYWTEDGEKVHFDQWEAAGQTDQALGFLDQQSDDQPFCLFVSWHPPHNHAGGDRANYKGFDAPEEFKALYDENTITPRPGIEDTPVNRQMTLGYYAMCSETDHHFGRLLDKLEEKGLAENTLVVYTSDHGETFGSHASYGHKRVPEDISARVPLLMRLPGTLPAGRESQLLFGTLDMAPTLAGLLGLEPPTNWHGRNLSKPILEGNDEAVESVPLFEFCPSWRGVYTRQYTFAIEQIDRDPTAPDRYRADLPQKFTRTLNVLYDRQADPHQQQNLINSTPHMGLALELTKQTHAWNAYFEDPFLTYTDLMDRVGTEGHRPPVDLLREGS